MLAVDTNILVYAHRREARVGDEAHALLAGLAEGERPWAIPWPCCYEFLSVVTNRRIWRDRASTPGALDSKFDTKIDALDSKFDKRFDALGSDVADAREMLARVEGHLMASERLAPGPSPAPADETDDDHRQAG